MKAWLKMLAQWQEVHGEVVSEALSIKLQFGLIELLCPFPLQQAL